MACLRQVVSWGAARVSSRASCMRAGVGGDWGLQVAARPPPAHVEGAGEARLPPLLPLPSGPVRARARALLLHARERAGSPLSPARGWRRKKKGSARMVPPPPQDLSPALPVSGPTDLAWASWGTESKLRTAGWAPTSAPPPEPSEKEVGGHLITSMSHSQIALSCQTWSRGACLEMAAWPGCARRWGPRSGRKGSEGPGQGSVPLLSPHCLLRPHLPVCVQNSPIAAWLS